MNKFYTCHFDLVQVGKKVLTNLIFASLDKKNWVRIYNNDYTISNYNEIKSLLNPPLNKDGSRNTNNLVSIITIIDLADKTKKPLTIKEVSQ